MVVCIACTVIYSDFDTTYFYENATNPGFEVCKLLLTHVCHFVFILGFMGVF